MHHAFDTMLMQSNTEEASQLLAVPILVPEVVPPLQMTYHRSQL